MTTEREQLLGAIDAEGAGCDRRYLLLLADDAEDQGDLWTAKGWRKLHQSGAWPAREGGFFVWPDETSIGLRSWRAYGLSALLTARARALALLERKTARQRALFCQLQDVPSLCERLAGRVVPLSGGSKRAVVLDVLVHESGGWAYAVLHTLQRPLYRFTLVVDPLMETHPRALVVCGHTGELTDWAG